MGIKASNLHANARTTVVGYAVVINYTAILLLIVSVFTSLSAKASWLDPDNVSLDSMNTETVDSRSQNGPCGRPYNTRIDHPYLISATWMYSRDTACEWQETLEQFHRIGGMSVLQFGMPIEKLKIQRDLPKRLNDNGSYEQVLTECPQCIRTAKSDLSSWGIDIKRIANWLYFESTDRFSSAVMCPGTTLDRQYVVNDRGQQRSIWRLILRHDSIASGCSYDKGTFDILFVEEIPAGLDQQELLNIADALDMEIYLGAPSFPVQAVEAWRPDYEMAPALMNWSSRVFNDYAQRLSGHSSFKGIYQTFEVALTRAWKGDGYDLYQQQASLLHQAIPDGRYAISPYFYVNKNQSGTDIAGTVDGYTRLVRAGIDLIMPQDGRGTGKSALYWPWQKKQAIRGVDPQLANYEVVNGSLSFESQFNASTFELYNALKRATATLSADEGLTTELWPNIEAFDEDRNDTSYTGCEYSDLSQTNKSRLDRAITFAGRHARYASFMYDPLFTCSERYSVSLLDEISQDYDRPLVTEATIDNQEIIIHGHNIAANTGFSIQWTDANGRSNQMEISAGRSIAASEDGEETIRLAFDTTNAVNSDHLLITAIAADGRPANAQYSLTQSGTDNNLIASLK